MPRFCFIEGVACIEDAEYVVLGLLLMQIYLQLGIWEFGCM